MAFPLFDLPAEAVELVLDSVDDLEDKRALRLVCKRTRAVVDSRVVAVWGGYFESRLSALVRAPWQLQRLDLTTKRIGAAGAAALATARWNALQKLYLDHNNVGPAGAAALAAAHLPALQKLNLNNNSLGDAGAAALVAARWSELQLLGLASNQLGPAGVSGGGSLARPPKSRPQS